MKFPTTNAQALLNSCRAAVDQVAWSLDQSTDPQAALMEYINTVLAHTQMLPYFRQHVVKPDLLAEVEQANSMRTKQPKWQWKHLPSAKDPQTGLEAFHYQGCEYKYKAGETKILSHEDVHQLIELTFCKVYLTRFL